MARSVRGEARHRLRRRETTGVTGNAPSPSTTLTGISLKRRQPINHAEGSVSCATAAAAKSAPSLLPMRAKVVGLEQLLQVILRLGAIWRTAPLQCSPSRGTVGCLVPNSFG